MATKAPDDEFGPDLLCDPSFTPCRDPACPREDLHHEHEVSVGNRSSRKLDACPRCQSPVVVSQTVERVKRKRKHTITASCTSCDWTFTNRLKKRTKQ